MKSRSRRICFSRALSVTLLFVATFGHAAQTTRVSVDSAGVEGVDYSHDPSISADGRYVAFGSGASNLVSGDTNGVQDILLHDRQTGATTRVSLDSAGGEAAGASFEAKMSAGGRFVAFSSEAANLVSGDTNAFIDVFVRDLNAGSTTRISVDSLGGEGDGDCYKPSISADGVIVAFGSAATNLVSGDTNGTPDVFVHDRSTGKTTRVSVDSAGLQGNDESRDPSISADGRYVAFFSAATNLVSGDTNSVPDVFVHDRNTGITTRVSVDSAGVEGNDGSSDPSISAGGRYVAFWSNAGNLISGDLNGVADVFVHDRNTAKTTRVSLGPAGVEGNDWSGHPSISADGRYVQFFSLADNLVPADTVGSMDVFIRDRSAATTSRISVSYSGGQANNGSYYYSSINADGRYVAFGSRASNLVTWDENLKYDVFVRDRLLNKAIEADLGIAVTSAPASVKKGLTGSYTFTITNNSSTVSAASTTLIDVCSSAPMSITPSQGSCNKSAVSVCAIGSLAPGASATVDVVIKATSRKPLTQQVSVSAAPVDSVPANNSAAVSTPVTR